MRPSLRDVLNKKRTLHLFIPSKVIPATSTEVIRQYLNAKIANILESNTLLDEKL